MVAAGRGRRRSAAVLGVWLKCAQSSGYVCACKDRRGGGVVGWPAAETVMTDDRIPYSRPTVMPGDDEAVAEVIREGRLVMGERVAGFERAIARFAGRAHGIAVTSGTSALELALRVLGVGPGWDVFVPAYTWVATCNVPLLLGARPILVDVGLADYCLTEAALREALADSRADRKLVLPVHLFGYRAGRGWLDAFVQRHGLQVLGDGCCAFGGSDDGVMCGAWSAIECLSFHPRKVITTGEGGMVLLDDDALAARCGGCETTGRCARRSSGRRRCSAGPMCRRSRGSG
jgi:perosamine synthetase